MMRDGVRNWKQEGGVHTDVVEYVTGKPEINGQLREHFTVGAVLPATGGAQEVKQTCHKSLQPDESAILHVVCMDTHHSHEVVAHAGTGF